MLKFSILTFLLLMSIAASAQKILDLYPEGIINQREDIEDSDNQPALYAYLPDTIRSSVAFLVIPGGGYGRVAMQHEGHDVARRLYERGHASFVLRYRLPNAEQQVDKRIAPIQDAQTALETIRKYFDEAALPQVQQVGVIGFSAGGHLAATLSTQHEYDFRVGHESASLLRPDFSVLAYPVISMEDGITHRGSQTNLIGPEPSEVDKLRFSNESNVNETTPPTFLMHAEDDTAVPIANSERYLAQLKHFNIPAVLFRYNTGGHGFGLNNKTDQRDWFAAMLNWINEIVEKNKVSQ